MNSQGGQWTPVKRVDWLGPAYMFQGLSRDGKLAMARLLPASEIVQETWLVNLGCPRAGECDAFYDPLFTRSE